MRIPRPTETNLVIGLAAIAFPLIWWGSPLLVALSAILGLGALWFFAAFPQPNSTTSPSDSAASETATPSAPPTAHASSSPHQAATTIVGVGLAIMAVVSGIDTPVLSTKVALSSLLVSRVLLVALPSRLGELTRLTIAHGGALIAAALMVEPTHVLTCVLWQTVWLAVDFSRVRFVAPAQAAAETSVAAANDAQDAPQNATAPAETITAAPANDSGAQEDGEAQTGPAPATPPRRSLSLVQAGGAAAAALAIAFLISVGIVQTIAPAPPQQSADASPQPDFDELWNQSPWIDRQRAAATPPPPPVFGSLEWACAQAAALEARGLHTLTAHGASIRDDNANADWAPAIQNFDAPPLQPASSQSANRVFGSACPGDANVRVVASERVRAASGYRTEDASDDLFVVGAIHALDLPDGRQLLVARAWRDTGDPAPSHLLMAWAQQDENSRSPAIWIVSSKGSMGVAGVLFAPQTQPLGGYHLWYGAMGADGALSASSADIIDVSGSSPRNTGPIPIWGASTCGQVPGDLLEPAEPNCAEQPAWAFWLTDFQYAPGGADEVMLTWRVRRQFGEAGEPAVHEEAFEETMHGRFVMSGGHWRFTGGEGALLADARFLVSSN